MIAPVQVSLELTAACNQRCLHCFADAGRRAAGELTTAELKRVLGELNEMGVMQINFSGGEPLLHEEFGSILEHGFETGPAQRYCILTNGTLLGQKRVDELADLVRRGADVQVQVGLDGFSPATYNVLRRDTPETFHTVVRNIGRLREAGVATTVLFTVSKATAPHAVETARFALMELQVQGVLLVPVFLSGRALENYDLLEFEGETWPSLVVEITRIKQDRRWGPSSRRLQIGFFCFYELMAPLAAAGMGEAAYEVWGFPRECSQVGAIGRDGLCEAAKTDLCITPVGDVFPCIPARSGPFRMGNVRERSVAELWRDSAVAKWFRESRSSDVPEPCAACVYLPQCGAGCRVSAYVLDGRVDAADRRCPYVSDWLAKKRLVALRENGDAS